VRALGLILLALVVAIQWPLWFGHGGWLQAHRVQRELASQQAINADIRTRNQSLSAEIASLREGAEAIEERARGDLRMMRSDELFFQIRSGGPAIPDSPRSVH
jgi:cell division protein FtsB